MPKNRNSNKNKPGKDQELLSYLSGRMTDKERNAFERKLEADPFLRDAVEGLSSLSASEVSDDLNELHRQLKSSRRVRRLPVWYRIGAAVIVLLIISSVFLFRDIKQPEKIAYQQTEEETTDVSPAETESPVTDKTELDVARGNQDRLISEPAEAEPLKTRAKDEIDLEMKEKSDRSTEVVAGVSKKVEEPEVQVEDKLASRALAAGDSLISREEVVVSNMPLREKSAAPAMAAETITDSKKKLSDRLVKGTVYSADEDMSLPGVSVTIKGESRGVVTGMEGQYEIAADSNQTLVFNFIGMKTREVPLKGQTEQKVYLEPDVTSLDEVVVVAYGRESKDGASPVGAVSAINMDEKSPSWSPPVPEGGMSAYRDYIKENLRFPEEYTESDREVVRVRFTVEAGREPYGFEILRSPGKSFSDETIRIIKEGARWQPAMSNGQAVTEEVVLRIVFKRSQ